MKKIMSLLGSALFVAAMTVACGGNAEPAETDTIDTTAIVLDEPVEEVVADTIPVEEEQVAAPAKKTTTKKSEPKPAASSREAAKQSNTTLPGLQQVGAEGTDARADAKKAEMKKVGQSLEVSGSDTKKK